MASYKKPRSVCLRCKAETSRAGYKYCSNKCQADYQYTLYIQQWLAGEIHGLQRLGVVSKHVKRYLRDKFGNKCCICGWVEINLYTGTVPLVADHIDGNWRNNIESNLRLICPNCDSLTAAYAALNKGKGRKQRPLSKRAQEGRLLMAGMPE